MKNLSGALFDLLNYCRVRSALIDTVAKPANFPFPPDLPSHFKQRVLDFGLLAGSFVQLTRAVELLHCELPQI